MKFAFLGFLIFTGPVFAQSAVPETEVTGARYRCETLADGLHRDLVTFYQMFGLRHEAFAIRLSLETDDSAVWHLKASGDKVGQEVAIRNRKIELGEAEHTAVIKPHHLVYESTTFHILGQTGGDGKVALEIRMDDDGSTVLKAECRVLPVAPSPISRSH